MAKKQKYSATIMALIAAALVFGGCDYFKKKEEPPKPAEPPAAPAPAPNGAGESTPGRVPRGKMVTGSIEGIPVQLNGGEISEGIITLWEGKDAFADKKVTVFLFIEEKGSIPEGRKFTAPAQGTIPHIHFSAVEGEKRVSGAIMGDYKMDLEFGKEGPKGKLPGKIDLDIPAKKVKVAGKFVLDIKGFRIIDGKPDLTSDSFETLKVVSRAHLEKENAGKAVEVVQTRDGTFTHASAKQPDQKQWGRNSIGYTLGGAQTNWIKHLYTKLPEGWTVTSTLLPHQVFEAHPVTVPAPEAWLTPYLQYVVAKKLDEELAVSHAGADVSGVNLQVTVDASKQSGTCEATYTLNSAEQPVKTTYALRLDGTNWVAEVKTAPAPAETPPSVTAPAPVEAPPPPPAVPQTNAPPAAVPDSATPPPS